MMLFCLLGALEVNALMFKKHSFSHIVHYCSTLISLLVCLKQSYYKASYGLFNLMTCDDGAVL